MRGFSIAGIGTDVGKTIASAILVESLDGCYFKPIQSGDLEFSDSIKVRNLCSNQIEIAPEIYKLSEPVSPHKAAEIDNVSIELSEIKLPNTNRPLILEGAGGILVPINNRGETMLDLYKQAGLPVILVSHTYLGSINHTLLSIEVLQLHQLKIAGIIYNGEYSEHTESIIDRKTSIKNLGRIPFSKDVNKSFIQEQAQAFKHLYYEL